MRTEQGFTLLELVTIMVLVGIVATFVTVRSGSDFKAIQDAEELIQAIRYTQEQAMNHTGDGKTYEVTINATNYMISVVSAMHTDNLDGILAGSTIKPTGMISFDGRGRPSCSPGLSCSNSVQDIVVSASGDSVTLTLEPHTGFVRR